MTPYQAHRKKWINCTRCPLHSGRSRVVLARGKVPCDVLFLGEAPGLSEDVIGQPFVGPAGHLLDKIIEQAIDGRLDYCLTNLVACLPRGDDGDKTKEPPEDAIEACAPRLIEFVELCRPKLIVLVGKLARKHIPWELVEKRLWVEIVHPAAILRMDVSQRGLAVQRCIVTVERTVEEMFS